MLTFARNITPAACAAVCLFGFGCASAAPQPKSPTSTEAAAPRAAAAADEPAEPATPASTEAPAETTKGTEVAQPADEPRDGLRKASRPPLELLIGNNVVYVFNFAGSKAGESAKERCESENQDFGAVRECLNKQRANLAVESIRFVKDPHGQYWWVTYNRYKGNLLKWHKIQFLPGKADDDSITLNLMGKDKGIAPMAKVPHALKIELPNDYSIVVSHPDHGPLVFDAKIGLMDSE